MPPKKKTPAAPKPPAPRTHPVPLALYEEVARDFFGEAKQLEMREAWADGPLTVRTEKGVYRVLHLHDVTEEAREMLTVPEAAAMLLPYEWLSDLLEETFVLPRFYELFLPVVARDPVRLAQLQTALLVSQQCTPDPFDGFWRSLEAMDATGLYGEAIVASAETYNFEAVLQELVEFMTEDGQYYSVHADGVFESVAWNEPTEEEQAANPEKDPTQWFFIHDTEDFDWDNEPAALVSSPLRPLTSGTPG